MSISAVVHRRAFSCFGPSWSQTRTILASSIYCRIDWFIRLGWRLHLFPFLLGFSWNHPFFTRFSCSNNSRIDQKKQNASTPKIDERIILSITREITAQMIPAIANAHQHFFPKWYSAFMTIGWNAPIRRKAEAPSIIPNKFIVLVFLSFQLLSNDATQPGH